MVIICSIKLMGIFGCSNSCSSVIPAGIDCLIELSDVKLKKKLLVRGPAKKIPSASAVGVLNYGRLWGDARNSE